MNCRVWMMVGVFVLSVGGLAAPAHAATSGSFVFDFGGDAGDNADGPQYDMTFVGLADDGGGCDEYVMVMIDPAGVVVDIDPGCTSSATADDDGDHGTIYAPTASPITYGLFDVTGPQAAVLSGMSQSDPAYLNYLVANGRFLFERTLAVDGLPTLPAYSFLRGSASVPVPTLGVFGLWALVLMMMGAFARQLRARRR